MDSFLLAVTARAADVAARRSGAALHAAITLEALPEAMLLSIVGWLPLHERVRGLAFSWRLVVPFTSTSTKWLECIGNIVQNGRKWRST